MKKFEFCVCHQIGDSHKAVIVKGYTDGVFYYYKDIYKYWYAIDPCSGLFACREKLLREAKQSAFKIMEKVKEYRETEKYKEMVRSFNELCLHPISYDEAQKSV